MLSHPGCGLLSVGMQQVSNRPFSLSEWFSLIPNEWTPESAPLVATYGLGLQGWDASFAFAFDYPHFTTMLHTPGVYNVMSPLQLSLYPALAAGQLGFIEKIRQQQDTKEYEGIVPRAALATGRVLVSFDDEYIPSKSPDLSTYQDTIDKTIMSTTGQLKWDYSGQGWFALNSPGTKAVVGFTGKQKIKLENISLSTFNPFAVIIISSLDRNRDIESAHHILVTTMARAQNKGMEFNFDRTKILNVGQAPILLEPVKVEMHFAERQSTHFSPLDHVGKRNGPAIPVSGDSLILDGEIHKTIYYELVYE